MAKSSRKKPKKQKKSTKRKKAPSKLRAFTRGVIRFFVVLGLWVMIGVGLLTAWYAAELPALIEDPKIERRASLTIEARNEDVIARYGDLTGVTLTVEELPPYMMQAVLAIEDRRFYQHFGLDILGVARAMIVNVQAGGVVQGGSTITQQLAKNLFLSHDRTLKRKIQEALLALWLERHMSKDEILSAYLNRVYMGAGTYGVDAAARLYFGKPATDINLREAATLAGLLKAPSRFAPTNNPDLAARRANIVLAAMHDAGYITEAEAERGKLREPMPRRKPGATGSVHYFADWISAEVANLLGTPDRDLIIRTTLHPDIQNAAEEALRKSLLSHGKERNISQGAIIVMAHDGAVLAMVGGQDYSLSQFNRAVQARRPPGSSFKPVVYLTALTQGARPHSRVMDEEITEGPYRPANFRDEYYGEVTLKQALGLSLNTVAVRLTQEVGIGHIKGTARLLGIRTDLERDLSLALGSSGVPMIEMATAYTIIANGGHHTEPYGILSITDQNGQLVYNYAPPTSQGRRLFPERTIRDLDEMMTEVVEKGTGRGAALAGRHVRGKTGTSQEFRDAWFIGFTDEFVMAVWLGNDDNSPMDKVTGGSYPAMIWRDAARRIYNMPDALSDVADIKRERERSPFARILDRLSLND